MKTFDRLAGGVTLIQDSRFFKMGQDSVLLADFAKPRKSETICELGCGNGCVSILMYLRTPESKITAVEIQPEVADLARENVATNGLSERISVVNADLREFEGVYDLVVCNPPYQPVGTGKPRTSEYERIAVTEQCCTLADVAEAAARLLRWGGRFVCVCRTERLAEFMGVLSRNGVEPKVLRLVAKNSKSSPTLFLLECRRGGAPSLKILPTLFTRDGDGESDELAAIYSSWEK